MTENEKESVALSKLTQYRLNAVIQTRKSPPYQYQTNTSLALEEADRFLEELKNDLR